MGCGALNSDPRAYTESFELSSQLKNSYSWKTSLEEAQIISLWRNFLVFCYSLSKFLTVIFMLLETHFHRGNRTSIQALQYNHAHYQNSVFTVIFSSVLLSVHHRLLPPQPAPNNLPFPYNSIYYIWVPFLSVPLLMFSPWTGCPVCCLFVIWLLVHRCHIISHCGFTFIALGQQQSNPAPLF